MHLSQNLFYLSVFSPLYVIGLCEIEQSSMPGGVAVLR